MGTVDLSRAAFDPLKRYAGVRMQQGRVNLDDDFNEGARIADDEERRVLLDLVGAAGSPDDGFRVSAPHPTDQSPDFTIGAGTIYLGGLRVWNPADVSYLLQPDWLEQTGTDRALPSDGRTDLVYLETWRQEVTAVEDAELFEAALAGPDTSARTRTTWRVHLAQGVDGSDCPVAWQDVIAGWKADGLGTVQPSGERTVDAVLTVGFEQDGPSGNLCSPAVAGGYLGAENQAIRVELTDDAHFTWGFDNAAPLYRVQISRDGSKITLLTQPKDQAHWPLADQVVEILAWSGVLPNLEKVAELSGHLSKVSASYSPDDPTIQLATPVPIGFGTAWMQRSDQQTLAPVQPDDVYYFLRVWYRGDDTAPAKIPFTPGTPVPLGATGLNVTFTGSEYVAADHWIIAARPETPDQLVPWSLRHGRPPHGVQRFFTPLALVQWHGDVNTLSWTLLHDCRPYLPSLTEVPGCCRYTVGDGQESFGRFSTIQDAIDALPPDGGTVCVLAGEFREQVTLDGKHDVIIEGCGPTSRIVSPDDKTACAILIRGCQDVTLRMLSVDGGDRPAIVIDDAAHPSPFGAPPTKAKGSTRIVVDEVDVTASAYPTISNFGASFFEVRGCDVHHAALSKAISAGDAGRWSAIYTLGDDVLIEGNRIVTEPGVEITSGPPTFTHRAMGGIQIAGGSDRVEVRRNTIQRGNGAGVTLGSIAWLPEDQLGKPFKVQQQQWVYASPGYGITTNSDGCIEIDWDPKPPDGDDPAHPLVPVSMGDLSDVRIVDNVITEMGGAGVGVVRFFDLGKTGELIRVDRLTIETNQVRGCLALPIPELPANLLDQAGSGAITLADADTAVIRDNTIEGNGRSHVDPVCGVFVLRGAGVSIERNRILDNAPRTKAKDPARTGFRGGVVIASAQPPADHPDGAAALRIVENVIVVPDGRCVAVLGLGVYAIRDNQLVSRGVGTARDASGGNAEPGTIEAAMDVLGGCTVFVANAGRSRDLNKQPALLTQLADLEVAPLDGSVEVGPVLAGGRVGFDDNQVTFDLMAANAPAIVSSVFLYSFDDVSIEGNQLRCDQKLDAVQAHVVAFAWALRLVGNRIEETFATAKGVTNAVSAMAMAVMATAIANQSTHCLMITGDQEAIAQNLELVEASGKQVCTGARRAVIKFKNKYMGSTTDA